MKPVNLASVATAVLAAACTGAPDTAVFRDTDSSGIAIHWNDVARVADTCAVSLQPTVSIGAADGSREYQLHRVFGATRLSDGRIVLVNQGTQELRFYDAGGKFLMAAGREGQGPGEFQDAFYLWLMPGDTIWVGNYRPWRYEVFAPDGKWVRTVKPEPQYLNSPDGFGFLSRNRAVLAEGHSARPESGYGADSIEVRVHSATGERTNVIGKFPNGRWGRVQKDPSALWIFPLFESFSRYAVFGERIAISASSEPEVRLMDSTGTVAEIIRWPGVSQAIAPSDVEAYRAREREKAKSYDSTAFQRYVEPLISTERPIAERFPALSELMFGTDGTLWVRTYRKPGVEGPARWMAFSPGGRMACHASVPTGIEVYEFGSNYLLGLAEDSLDVQRVVKYDIKQPEKAGVR